MRRFLYKVYAYIFGKKLFYNVNKFLFQLSLRGMGILNHETDYITGEIFWLKKYLKNIDKPLVIDIGANIGKYSSKILEINTNSNLIAFEPHPKTYNVLCSNINSKNFKAYNLGVGKEKDILKLYDYADNDGSAHASVYKDVIEDIHSKTSTSHEVQIVNLDDFLNIEKIDLLKIDTEGNEFNVLQGAKKHLESNKVQAIHFEFNEMNIISKTTFKDFMDFLPNYNLFRILPGGKLIQLKQYVPVTFELYAFQNIVAILKNNES